MFNLIIKTHPDTSESSQLCLSHVNIPMNICVEIAIFGNALYDPYDFNWIAIVHQLEIKNFKTFDIETLCDHGCAT